MMAGSPVMHDFYENRLALAASLPVQLEAGGDALAAGGLAEVGDCCRHLEWTIKLLFGAERVVGDRVIAGSRNAGTERGAGRQDIELDGPFIAEHLRRQRRR